jgi:hypothetical protein
MNYLYSIPLHTKLGEWRQLNNCHTIIETNFQVHVDIVDL